jgi:primosomal protein N' (replication factor Y)
MMPKGRQNLITVQPLGGFDQLLTYSLKEEFSSIIRIGSLVKIPLGKRKVLGIVWSLNSTEIIPENQIRSIHEVVHQQPVLTEEMTKLAKWISKYYCCSIDACLEAMIPAAIRDGVKIKTRRQISLSKRKGEEEDSLLNRSPAQASIVSYLRKRNSPISVSELLKETGRSASSLISLKKKGIIQESEEIVEREAYEDDFTDSIETAHESISLTLEQQTAIQAINDDLKSKKFKAHLLNGVTGSGKTEVYFEAMELALSQNGSVLFLVPEVALAPQTVSRIRNRFKDEKIVVWHSHLSTGERTDAWRSLIERNSKIVVGARSAIFSPLNDLRLIIVDEEHEPAYKQEDTPRYHARDVAVLRAKFLNATCVLGSATPSLETLHNVSVGKYGVSELTQRVDNRELPLIHLVDMRREAEKKKSLPILSQPLVEALRERVQNREQSILFLNRRGFNTTMLCPDCGHVETCKDCSIAMTFHRTDFYLRCHLCGYRKPAPSRCSECQSFDLQKKGHGTQRIEDLVADLLPRSTRIRRIDADVMSKKNLFRETLSDFRKGKIDILVGTQMIAKGLDFPRVTLVGVIDADLPLRIEDFRASERAFQMLVQVSGRAGRGSRAGEVYVQTYAPFSPSIQFARKSDLQGFTEDELKMREEFGYPPFRHLIRHLFKSRSEAKVDYYSSAWAKELDRHNLEEMTIKGPAPAPLEKIKGYFRYHFFYFTKSVSSTITKLSEIRKDFPLDPEVQDILDVDAHQIS